METLLNSRKHLYALTVGLCLAVLVGGWFLLISPKRAAVAELRGQVDTQESSNDGLRAQVQGLQALQAKLPQQQAALARIQSKVPDEAALPELLRVLNQAAIDSGVKLTGVTPTAPAAIANATGVSGVDVALLIEGDYVALEQYHLALEGLSRAFLVNGLQLAEGGSAGPSATTTTAAATVSGTGGKELSATINGRILFRTPAGAAPAAPTTPDAATTTS